MSNYFERLVISDYWERLWEKSYRLVLPEIFWLAEVYQLSNQLWRAKITTQQARIVIKDFTNVIDAQCFAEKTIRERLFYILARLRDENEQLKE